MIHCKKCGKTHGPNHPHIVSRLREKGYPTSSKRYPSAHEEASKEEKERYPKGYAKLKKLDIQAGEKHELLGTNKKNGKIEVSKKVPKPLRSEVAFHEKVESNVLRGKNADNKRKK